jgi:hypothetical protein
MAGSSPAMTKKAADREDRCNSALRARGVIS